LAVRDSIDIGAGVIDQDYRGELKVLLINNGTDTAIFHYGMRVAQIVFERIETPAFTQMSTREFDEYDTTNRGVGGFGSTGSGILKSL
jgi:dUTP pyrophosphatase